jgi:hypothetical protein
MTPRHVTDEQCRSAFRLEGGRPGQVAAWTCPECGVYHGDACPFCYSRGFHHPGCRAKETVSPRWRPDHKLKRGQDV